MEAIALKAADQAAGSCFALATSQINKVLSYIRRYNDNMADIRSQRQDLEMLKKEIEQRVQAGERKLETIVPLVDDCLKDAEAFLADDEWNDFMDEDKINERDQGCFSSVRMNLKYRYLVSKRAADKCRITKEKIMKMKDCSSRAVTLPGEPPKLGSTPTAYFKNLASRESTLKEIMQALKDKKVITIGIYGMGGIGKTILIEEVARRVEVDGSFSEVVIAEVSQAPDILKMQQQIAERIDLPLQDSKSADERARKIHERLKKKIFNEEGDQMLKTRGRQVVVILDNIWKKLDLDKVGIPRDCKIILTTRSELVCREMGANKKFEVRGLNDTEAVELFLERVGRLADHDDGYRSVTSELVKKCGGLPLAIIALADMLRDRDLSIWQHVAAQLGRPVSARVGWAMEENVYPILEWSYNFISSEEKKKFFLLCCLFPLGSSIVIQDLMRYGAGLGLFQYINSLGEAIEQANSWVAELKSSSLLLEAEDERYVKIHDVVRAASMSIAAKEESLFLVGSFPRWLMKETFETYTAISMTSDDNHEPLSRFRFPRLEMLLLDGSYPSEFSNNFFHGMKSLKVLVMSDMTFSTLPYSIVQLENLRTLHLEYCEMNDISAVVKLVDLLFLSLRGSIIDELPKEFENLVHLKVLDLTECSMLQKIPAGIIARLTELEGLYMMHSFEKWDLGNSERYNENEGGNNEEKGTSLIELKSLPYLVVLEIHVPSIHLLPDDLLFPHLSRFLISIGNEPADSYKFSYEEVAKTSQWRLYSQILFLENIDASMLLKQSIDCLLQEVECLMLKKITGLTNVTGSLIKYGFRNLKSLHIERCSDMEYITSTNELKEEGALPRLEELYAKDMFKLKAIYHGPDLYDYFFHLKKLYLSGINFIQNFWDNGDMQDNQPFFSKKMKFSNLEELIIINVRGIKELWHLADVEEEVLAFPRLAHLILWELPDLRSIWRSNDIIIHRSFRNLENLDVRGCSSLEMLCPLSMAIALQQLNTLTVIGNANIKEIIAKETGEMKNNDTEMIVFPKLQDLFLRAPPNLKYFFGGSIKLVLSSLESIHCSYLKEMVAFVSSEYPGDSYALFNDKVVLPAIKDITFDNVYGFQEIWGSHSDTRSFNELESLEIVSAKKAMKVFLLDAIKQMQNLKELNLQQFQLAEEFIELVGFYNDELENLALLPQLTNLVMHSFPRLKWIPWKALALKNLRDLKISEIHGLTSLFPASVCRMFVNLEALSIIDCEKMEEIVGKKSRDTNIVKVKIVFPQLNFLRLGNLPAFRSLGSDNVIFDFPSIKVVCFDKFQNPILLDLFQKFQHVKELQLGGCEALLELFDIEGGAYAIPPRLRKLMLYDMFNLQRIPWTIFLVENLHYLKISGIHGLKFLFLASMCSKGFVQLEEIHIDDCDDLEQVLAEESIEDTSNNVLPITVVLPRVKIIRLSDLQSLRSFSSENYKALEFPFLEEVKINQCPMMKKFSFGSLNTPKLRKININWGDEEECFDLNAVLKNRIKENTSGEDAEGESIEEETSEEDVERESIEGETSGEATEI